MLNDIILGININSVPPPSLQVAGTSIFEPIVARDSPTERWPFCFWGITLQKKGFSMLFRSFLTAMLFFLFCLLSSPGWAEPAKNRFVRAWPQTDFSQQAVPLAEIISGGPPKDGIPAIDRPRFVSLDTAADWLDPREPVIALEVKGVARAYPLQILMFHEIVNDRIGGLAVTVTFCPLCNAAIVFKRQVNGKTTTFGTTGMLRNSDLIMYDRLTESWWQQFTGKGIVGAQTGVRLERLPSTVLSFVKFQQAFPKGMVLSKNTGYTRNYGRNPYRGYDRVGNNPFLLADPADPRLPAMERVLGVGLKGQARVYAFSTLAKQPLIHDQLAGEELIVFSRPGTLSALDAGIISESRSTLAASAFKRRLGKRLLSFQISEKRIADKETGSEWNLLGRAIAGPLQGQQLTPLPESGVHFAFAWLAFRPESTVYD